MQYSPHDLNSTVFIDQDRITAVEVTKAKAVDKYSIDDSTEAKARLGYEDVAEDNAWPEGENKNVH
jgi:hypothetical protein